MQAPTNDTETIVTYKELYRRAWETPLETLAKELGVTSPRRIRIFEQLQIPYPRRSYWKRKLEGKFVFERELPSPARKAHKIREGQ